MYCTDEDPDDLEGTALHLIEQGRKDILQILLDYGGDVNQKDCMVKTVMSRVKANGDEILCPMLGESHAAGCNYVHTYMYWFSATDLILERKTTINTEIPISDFGYWHG